MQFFSGEAPAVPDPSGVLDLGALMPPWAQQLTVVTLLVLIVAAFFRGWVITNSKHAEQMAREREIGEIYKKAAEDANANVERLSTAFSPILAQNDAILKAVTEVQEEQRRYRERGTRR